MTNLSQEERNTRTAVQYLQHIVDGSGRQGKPAFDQAFALVSEDFTIQVMPGSMKMPELHLDRYRRWLEPMVDQLFDTFEMKVIATTAQDNRVVVEATSSARTKDGRPYGQQYFISFIFNDRGQITHVKEFVDSHYSLGFYGLPQEEA
jgi:ketosteroid isomerase-like protein